MQETAVLWLSAIVRELTLFAAAGLIVGGLSDIAIDVIWLVRSGWRRVAIHARFGSATVASMTPPRQPGPIAIFVAAWDESEVIGPMLRHAAATLAGGDWRLYVGAYPNDPATIAAVRAVDCARIRLVIGPRDGPTTKADCLNAIWQRMLADEVTDGQRTKAIVLHDAEDVVHSAEIGIYDRLIERFALVQLPVLPLVDAASRFVAGHYNDEFAESHGKTLVVREAIGAAIPSAGVGCAFDRGLLGRIAETRGGTPFDADSLTEDYELGLAVAQLGGRGAFVRIPAVPRGPVVAIRAHFPATLDAAVRQKARWMVGIALSGWDRLGWRGGFSETWMRLHDRRALIAAAVLLAAYAALLLGFALQVIIRAAGISAPLTGSPLSQAMVVCALIMLWRLIMRVGFVTRDYGWREGVLSVPRAVVANVIAMMAARRAVALYLRMRRDGVVRWEKTAHHFPAVVAAE